MIVNITRRSGKPIKAGDVILMLEYGNFHMEYEVDRVLSSHEIPDSSKHVGCIQYCLQCHVNVQVLC